MTIWRMHIRPEAETGHDPVEFCLTEGLVGIGWQLPRAPADKADCECLAAETHRDAGSGPAYRIMLHEMKEGDLVWFRDLRAHYYLARITGEWFYDGSAAAVAADLVNLRPASIMAVGLQVPGGLRNQFGPGQVVRRIKSPTVCAFSMLLANERWPGAYTRELSTIALSHDLFDLLDPYDTEDLVALYLQRDLGYMVLPSSRNKQSNTICYEYELLSRNDFSPAFVQVKSGQSTTIELSEYAAEHRVYLFSAAGYLGSCPQNVTPIERSHLLQFVRAADGQLPEHLQRWLDFSKAAGADFT